MNYTDFRRPGKVLGVVLYIIYIRQGNSLKSTNF